MRAMPLILIAAALAAADPETDLRAAYEARAARAAEERAWTQERERLQAAIDALTAQSREDRTAATDLEARIAAVRSGAPEVQATAAVRSRIAPREAELVAGLAALRASALPGTIAVPAETAAAVDALDAAERAAGQVAASIETVRIDGRDLAVRILRAGLHHAWWISLDGAEAGPVTVAAGALSCTRAADPAAIRSLFAQFDGREAPRWLAVPP